MKTNTLPRRIIAVFLTLTMVFSVFTLSFGTALAANEWYNPAKYTVKGLKFAKNLAKNTKFIKAYGGYIGVALDILSVVIDFCKEDEPSDEEIKIDYLIEQVDAMKNQLNVMSTDLKNFLTNNNKLQGFDNAYMAVEHNFGVTYQENFEKMVSAYATDENISEATRLQLLSKLIGDSSTWHQSNSVIYNYDTYANYLLGSTTVFSGNDIYQAAIEYYRDTALFGKEVLDRYENEFFARSYGMYVYAMTKLITCLEARKDLMISRGDETSLVEANVCIRKIDAYAQSLAPILKLYYQNRVDVNPCEFYDRHDSSQPMQIRLLNDEMGFFSYFQEAVDRYNQNHPGAGRINYDDYEDLLDLTVQQRRTVTQEWFDQNFYGGENSGNYTPNVIPSQSHSDINDSCNVVELIYNSGIDQNQIDYICDYIEAQYPDMTLREFLAYCGFDVNTSRNAEALHLLESEDGSTGKTYYEEINEHYHQFYVGYLRFNGFQLDSAPVELEEDISYSDPLEEYFADKNDISAPKLFFRTTDIDTAPLEEALEMALAQNQSYVDGFTAYTAESIQSMMSFVQEVQDDLDGGCYTTQTDVINDAKALYNLIFSLEREEDADTPHAINDISQYATVEATVNDVVVTAAEPGATVKIKALELGFGCSFNHYSVTTVKSGAPVEVAADDTFIMPDTAVNVECVVDFVDYPFWVDGVQATHDNYADICGDGKASFDTETLTLTLNNVSFNSTHVENGIPAVIYSELPITIRFIGENQIAGNGNSYGIYIRDPNNIGYDLTLTGNGNLNIINTRTGIFTDGILNIKGMSISAGSSQGAFSASEIVLAPWLYISDPEGGVIQNGSIVDTNSYTAYNATISVKADGIVGDTNVDTYVNIKDVTQIQRHLAELELFNDYQLGLADVDRNGAVTIADATTLQGYLAEFDCDYPIGTTVKLAPSDITMVDAHGTTTASVNGAPVTEAKQGDHVTLSYTLNDTGYTFTGWTVVDADGAAVTLTNGNTFVMPNKAVTVTSNTRAVSYGLYVGNREVTALNQTDVLGNGRVSYDPSTQTLTLNGASLSQGYNDGFTVCGIYCNHSLTINVTGNNTVQVPSSDYGIFVNGNLTITGNGKLTVSNAMNGIYAANGNLTFNARAAVTGSQFAVAADNEIVIGSYWRIGTPADAVNQGGMIFSGGNIATEVTIVTG